MDRALVICSHLQTAGVAGQSPQQTPPPSPQYHVLHERHSNGLLSITLNRPQALNALSPEMLSTIKSVFQNHTNDLTSRAIMISSSGNAFCAGGDIRYLAELLKKGDVTGFSRYLMHEYSCDRMTYVSRLPYVALLDGIWMGGGVGITFGAKFKVVTEKTQFAMPETAIGFLPDVSGSHFLPRLKSNVGIYAGLLGIRLRAADCLYTGIATHFVPSSRLQQLKAALQSSPLSDAASLEKIINEYSTTPPDPPALKANEEAIRRCFSANTVEEIIARLQREQSPWATETLRLFSTRSPTALKVSLAAFKKGATMSLDDALNMEHQVCVHLARHADFAEGVRAVIFDKDNKPRWQPSKLEDISAADVERFFVHSAPIIKFS